MNPFSAIRELWKAVRDLEEAIRQIDHRLKNLETVQAARRSQRDWILTKLIPAIGSLGLLFAALDTLFHWTT